MAEYIGLPKVLAGVQIKLLKMKKRQRHLPNETLSVFLGIMASIRSRTFRLPTQGRKSGCLPNPQPLYSSNRLRCNFPKLTKQDLISPFAPLPLLSNPPWKLL